MYVKALGLKEVPVHGFRIFYAPSFQQHLDAIKEQFAKLSTRLGEALHQHEKLRAQSEAIIRDINTLAGWSPGADAALRQRQSLEKYATNTAQLLPTNLTFSVIPKMEAKQYLRTGGSLPHTTYDPATDTAHITAGWAYTSDGPPLEAKELYFPVDSMKELEETLNSLKDGNNLMPGVILHELVESALFERLGTKDPFFRWFSDGFANAITEVLLRKFIDPKTADQFVQVNSVEPYRDLAPRLLLRYWMGNAFCVNTPLSSEKRLTQARYNYATHEARRLIEKHGADIAGKAIDLVLKERQGSTLNIGDLLLRCFQKVTGEDLEARFSQYQPFRTTAEGIGLYQKQLKEAVRSLRHEDALSATLRLIELQADRTRQLPLSLYREAAIYLFEATSDMKAAIGILQDRLKAGSPWEARDFNLGVLRELIRFLWTHSLAGTAEEPAKQLLAANPADAAGLVVQMDLFTRNREHAEAKKLAEKIAQSTVPEESPFVMIAQYTLARIYNEGEGVPRDLAQARSWIGKAAENGNTEAARNLALFYLRGAGGPANNAEAVRWMTLAADRGDAEAHKNLAAMYWEGKAVAKFVPNAIEHMSIVAETGDPAAQFHLAELYYFDDGLSKNLKEAFKWASLAADAGEERAVPLRQRIAAELSPADTTAATSGINEWKRRRSEQTTGTNPNWTQSH